MFNSRPASFLRNVDPLREQDGLTLTLDVMIGNEEFVGKGIAHLILGKFIQEKCHEAVAILVDPEVTHKKAIHVYEKTGFVPQGIYIPQEGSWAGIKHLIMKKKTSSLLVAFV